MQRVEPTFGNLEMDVNAPTQAQPSAPVRRQRLRKAVREWMVTALVLFVALAACIAVAA
ncbi:MAG: hypothetical protein ABI411_04575 [Tahibacter sp.]